MEQLKQGNLGKLPIFKIKERPPKVNILIYGTPGIGKTVLCGSADAVPMMRPVLLLDIEGGTNSLRTTYSNVDTVRISSWPDLIAALDAIDDGDHEYQTIIIDSLSEIQKINMYYNMRKAGKNPMEDKADWDDYSKSLESMRHIVRSIRDLPYNTIFTALVEEEKDTKTGKTMKRPYFTGKFKHEVPALPDEVFYYYAIEQYDEEQDKDVTVRCLLTSATDTTVAKDRSGMLDQVIFNPTMSVIYNAMYNNKKES